MPIDVRPFGVGHRRPQGPQGSQGVEGLVVYGDARGVVTELAFARQAHLEPHESPNSAWLCVIEGGGWVLVGDERRRVAAGEAISWPAGVVHAAWTDQSHMRAIQVELAGPDDSAVRGILEGRARLIGPGEATAVARGMGQLAERPPDADRTDGANREGEPM
jgi:quercetin dioxygenase-like cupin family protein